MDVLVLRAPADVERPSNDIPAHDAVNRHTVVLDEQPVANLTSITINRQRDTTQRIDDDQRDELFGKLIGPVVVRTVAYRDRKPVGVTVRAHQMVRCRFARSIRRIGRIWRRLGEWRIARAQRTVYLVGRDMMEADSRTP